MPGTPIDITIAVAKMQQRIGILNAAKTRIATALGSNPAISDAKTYFGIDKNAYVFDISKIGEYFADGSVNSNYQGATHLLVIEGAHNATSTVDGVTFTKNEPTVIIMPVAHVIGNTYVLVGNQHTASLEWPPAFATDTINPAIVNPVLIREESGNIEVKSSKNLEKEPFIIENFTFEVKQALPSVFSDKKENSTHETEDIQLQEIPESLTSRGISVNEAKDYLIKVADIKSKFNEIISNAIINSKFSEIEKAEAKRYYTEFRDAYVFDKASIEMIMDQMKKDSDCLIFFEGVRKDVESDPKNPLFAKPTLIGFVYQLEDDHVKRLETNDNKKSGIEYPPILNLSGMEHAILKEIPLSAFHTIL